MSLIPQYGPLETKRPMQPAEARGDIRPDVD
jgi:hypothetical protein